jgi:hypothetical protein
MSRAARVAVLVVTLLVTLGGVGAAATTWPRARLAALPSGSQGLAQGYLPVLACASAGNCVAAGDYLDTQNNTQGVLLNEVNGAWRAPITIVPPADAASTPGVTPASGACRAVGDCVVVGSYVDRAGNAQAFVVSERRGAWSRATKVALPANAITTGQSAQLRAVACGGGACSAVGTYLANGSPSPQTEGMTLTSAGGAWSRATEVALPATAGPTPYVTLSELACAATPVGDCSATGTYLDADNTTHGLIVNEVNGVWRAGVELVPPANVNAVPLVQLSSLACPGPGDCAAIGTYESAAGHLNGLTVDEVNGVWRAARTLALPVAAAVNPLAFLYGFTAVSCSSVGNCAAGGQYRDGAGHYQGFLVNEVNGVWRAASELRLPAGATTTGKNGGVVALSCYANGACAAGAAYLDPAGHYQALVVTATHGRWGVGTKVQLPGTASSVGVDGGVYSLICASATRCTAAGSYLASSTIYQGFTLTLP